MTIAGESAGAMSVTTLTAMPAARGLFRRVIAQSGAGHHVLHPATADKITAALCGFLGVAPTAEAVAAVPLDRLLAAHDELVVEVGKDPDPARWGEVAANMMPFEPVVDGDSLPGVPYAVIAAGDGADVDLLIGHNDDEHTLFLYPLLADVDEARVRGTLRGLPRRRRRLRDVCRADRPHAARRPAGGRPHRLVLPAARPAARGGAPGPRKGFVRLRVRLATAPFSAACSGPPTRWRSASRSTPSTGPRVGRWSGDDPPQDLADAMHGAWVAFVRDGDPGWPAYGDGRHDPRFGGHDDGEVVADPDAERRLAWPER